MNETHGLLTGPAAGFVEYTPAGQRAFNQAYARLVRVAERFGFTPLETAAVERVATLSSKGVLDKEVYGLRRLKAEDGDDSKDLGLHFDLTVPMARYVSANQQHLVFPFRRWQSQPVWRGERPQVGRYRQFYQFDLDHVGRDTLPVAADAEVLAAAFMGLRALDVGPFVLRVNDRRLLTGLLDWAGFGTEEAKLAAMKVIDDLEKVAPEVAHERLVAIARENMAPEAKVGALLDLLRAEDGLAALAQVDLPEVGQVGLASVQQVLGLAKTLAGLAKEDRSIRLDLSIVRGLDYYTGTVVETKLLDAPELGSVCSGGRYENLTASLGGNQLPGVGMSFGLSRLMVHLLGLPEYANVAATPALVGVTCQNEAALPAYAALAQSLRTAGLNVEQCLGGALGTQIKNLAKRGVVWAVMANADELAAGTVQLKHLPSGAQTLVPVAELAEHIVNAKH